MSGTLTLKQVAFLVAQDPVCVSLLRQLEEKLQAAEYAAVKTAFEKAAEKDKKTREVETFEFRPSQIPVYSIQDIEGKILRPMKISGQLPMSKTQFATLLQEELAEVLGILSPELVLAGDSVCNLLRRCDKNRAHDLYFLGCDEEKCVKLMNLALATIAKRCGRNGNIWLYRSKREVVIQFVMKPNGGSQLLKFHLARYKGLPELLNSFVVASCAVAYDGTEVHTTAAGNLTHRWHMIVHDPLAWGADYERRLESSVEQGFVIIVPNATDRENIVAAFRRHKLVGDGKNQILRHTGSGEAQPEIFMCTMARAIQMSCSQFYLYGGKNDQIIHCEPYVNQTDVRLISFTAEALLDAKKQLTIVDHETEARITALPPKTQGLAWQRIAETLAVALGFPLEIKDA